MSKMFEKIHKDTMKHLDKIFIRNAALNIEIIKKRFEARSLYGLNTLPKITQKSALITGSGFSLDLIKKEFENDFIIFTSLSHAGYLLSLNIRPNYIVATDCSPELSSYVIDADIPLITHTCIDNQLLKRWKGPVYIFQMQQVGNRILNQIIPCMYTKRIFFTGYNSYSFENIFKISIKKAGCVSNTSIQIADYLGARNIFLLGVDYSFFKNKGRFNNRDISTTEPIIRINSEVTTTKLMQFYEMCLYALWYRKPEIKLYNFSMHSLIDCPRVNVKNFNLDMFKKYPEDVEAIKKAMKAKLIKGGFLNEKNNL